MIPSALPGTPAEFEVSIRLTIVLQILEDQSQRLEPVQRQKFWKALREEIEANVPAPAGAVN